MLLIAANSANAAITDTSTPTAANAAATATATAAATTASSAHTQGADSVIVLVYHGYRYCCAYHSNALTPFQPDAASVRQP